MKRVYILILLIAAAVVSQGQQHRSWVQRFDGSQAHGGGDTSPLCASDAAGNTYVAGTTAVYGLSSQPVAHNITIIKYDVQGAKQWLVTYEHARDVVSVSADANGNVYILAGKEQTLLLKYDPQGSIIWEWAAMGGEKNKPLAMDIDNAGNIYVASSRRHTADSADVTAVKIAPAGNVTWSRSAKVSGSSAEAFIDADATGNLWMVYNHAVSSSAAAVHTGFIKLDASGNTAWNHFRDLTYPKALKLDNNGNAYVLAATSSGSCAAQLTKLDNAGNEAWVSCDMAMDDVARNMLSVDANGNIVIAGTNSLYKTRITFFDNTGTGLWAQGVTAAGVAKSSPFAVCFDEQGNIKVAGEAHTANGKSNYFAAQYSSSGNNDWTAQYDAPPMLNDKATGIAMLPGGKLAVTGEAMYSQSKDFVTVCYDAQGAELWIDAADGKELSMERAFVQDIDPFTGDIYAVGQGKGPGLNTDMLTVKYRADGTFQWAKYFGGAAEEPEYASGVKADGNGHVIVAGRTVESMSPRINAVRLIKYDENGNVLWNVSRPDTGFVTTQTVQLALGNDGSVYACAASAGFKMLLLKYSSAGQLLWEKKYKAPDRYGWHDPASIKVDAAGNAYVAGNSMHDIGLEVISVIKVSSSGDILWMKEAAPASSAWSKTNDMEIDAGGNVYVSGHFHGTDYINRFVTAKLTADGEQAWLTVSEPSQHYHHLFNDIELDRTGSINLLARSIASDSTVRSLTSVIRLGSNGQEQWRQTFGNDDASFLGYEITSHENGSLFITGNSYNAYPGGQWIFTAAVSSSGNIEWIDTLAVSTAGQSYAIDVHPDGGIYVSGALGGFYEGLDLGLIRYEQSPLSNGNILAAANIDLSVFPNPVPGSFTVTHNASGDVCIEVLDLAGKKVHCVNLKNGELSVPMDVTHLNAGSYVVRAVTTSGVITRPIVVVNKD